MTIKLHCFGESGNAYKAALALQLAGLDWEPVYVDFFNGGAKTEEFLKLNPMGEVPVMESDDLVLTQSGVIQKFVSDNSGKLGGTTKEEEWEILRWILWDNHKHSSLNGNCRFLCNFIPQDKQPEQVVKWLKGRLHGSYQVLEQVLENQDWLVGDRISNADISCCGYLYYPEPFGFERSDWPAIDRWLNRISSQQGWKHPYELMPGNPSDRQST